MRRLLILWLLTLGAAPAAAQDTARAELVFLNVGQGDAIVVRSPEGKTALIDAGPQDISGLLAALGVDTIDLAIASHPHADHIGGMEQVLGTFAVRYYLDNSVPHTTATYRSLMARLERSNTTYLQASARAISLGSVTLRILPPPARANGSLNNQSVGVVVEFGRFKALLTGDSEREELAYFLEQGVPDVDVLKAAHHGSANGVTRAWLAATQPEVVVISCGAGNGYGHPHGQALALYHAAATVYRTDLQGSVGIWARADGTFDVETAGVRERPDHAAPSVPSVPSVPSATALIVLSVHADAPGNDHQNPNGEYVILENKTSKTIGIGGWTLCDLARHCYTFPPAAAIAPRNSVVLFTGTGRNDGRRFYTNRRQAVWNNDGDVAVLFDRKGGEVARHAY